jgi:hypothetical protein
MGYFRLVKMFAKNNDSESKCVVLARMEWTELCLLKILKMLIVRVKCSIWYGHKCAK